ncbi:MAG: cation:proton antiporter subunit C [Bacteroidales bacterium]|nr:cation:proton antiporter subunit C [Bacteroidales bacterium]
MQEFLTYSIYGTAFFLMLLGLYAVLMKKNLVKIVIGLTVLDSGLNLLFVAVGYISGGTAPIFSPAVVGKHVIMTDPVPQALVLTAIVIGFGVTAVALALVVRLYRKHNTTNIDEIKNLKW